MTATLTLHGSKFVSKMAGLSIRRVPFSSTLFARWTALAGGCIRNRFYSAQSQESQAPEDEFHVNYLDGDREGFFLFAVLSESLSLSLSVSLLFSLSLCLWTHKLKKVSHSATARSQTLATGFTVQHINQPVMKSS